MLSVYVLKLLTASLECWLQLTSNLKKGRIKRFEIHVQRKHVRLQMKNGKRTSM